ncbi:MAG: pyridoxal-phosphate dependent enzyme [Chloroflexota bacterium]
MQGTTVTEEALRAAVDREPRVQLAFLPTPLHEMPRLTRELGGARILVKRDDLTGLALGGNKSRVLEFVMGDALQSGATTIVAAAYAQSNYCRQAAAAAAQLGLGCHLVLRAGIKSDRWQGNLLLDKLLGAQIHLISVDSSAEILAAAEQLTERLRAEGEKPYLVTLNRRAQVRAAIAYIGGFLELQRQLREIGVKPDRIYLSSSGNSYAGMLLAAKATGFPTKIVGVSPEGTTPERSARSIAIANDAAAALGLGVRLSEEDGCLEDSFLGPSYGIPTPGSVEAVQLLARLEGILVDPIYTGKGLAGLISHVRSGVVGRDETVVFVHTGGVPGIFAFAEELVGNPEVDR